MFRSTPTARRLALGLCAIAALAACSDVATAPTGIAPSTVSTSVSPELNGRHLFHTKDYYAKAGGAARVSGTGISYHGGPVIASPSITKVVAIYWGTTPIYQNQPASGTGPGTSDGSLIGSFLSHLGGSSYFNINTTYTLGTAHVLNQVGYTSYWATGSDVAGPTASPTDAQMAALIQTGFNTGKLTYDPNTIYAIFTGPGINLGGGFISQYCAYHTHASTTQGTVLYAAMPHNQDSPTACTPNYASPNTDVAANSEVNTLAHEIEETTTDPMGTAWYDSRGQENGDKCAWTWGTIGTSSNGGKYDVTFSDGKQYLIQRNWVNAGSGGCAISY